MRPPQVFEDIGLVLAHHHTLQPLLTGQRGFFLSRGLLILALKGMYTIVFGGVTLPAFSGKTAGSPRLMEHGDGDGHTAIVISHLLSLVKPDAESSPSFSN